MKSFLYAIRALRRQPGFAAVTMLTLALGIGANTAVFSVINGVLLRPLPYPQPERLEYITSQFPTLGFNQFWISMPEFVEFRDHNRAFSSVGAYAVGAINLDTNPPGRPVAASVSPELMPTLGVQPERGRWFRAEDSQPGAAPVAILSWELWQRAYGGDESVLGRTIQVNGRAEEIVGVMPRGYDIHESRIEIWRPLVIDPATFPNSRGSHFLYLVGRLKDDVNREQALADIDRLIGEWREIAPMGHIPSVPNHKLRLDPLKEDIVGSVRQALLVLQAAVVFVLLIACANLANLLIARADARHREYAVRTALGASRAQLFRQLLTEGLVLTIPSAILGAFLAYVGVTSLVAVSPTAIPRASEITLDLPVLGFTLLASVATGLIFALVPLLHLRSTRHNPRISETSTRTTAGSGRIWVRSSLVVVEVALAVTLVAGAGLLIRSFVNLTQVDPGFNRSNLSTFGLVLPGPSYPTDQVIPFYRELTSRLKSIGGVQSVSAMSGLPPRRNVNANDTDFEHIPNNRPPGSLPIENVDFYQIVTLGYTETMGIPVVSGRTFEFADTEGAPAALINETAAKRFFEDRDPIGGRLRPGLGPNAPFFTVIGVLKDVKQAGVDSPVGTELYLLAEQGPRVAGFAPRNMNFVVRSTLPLESLAPSFRDIVRSMDASLPLVNLQTMDDAFGAAIERPRFLMLLLAIFAGVALTLAAVGTYGILSYLVSLRTQEIGIRMALGADRGGILRLVLRRGLVLTGLGLLVGLAVSIGATRVMSTMLFGVEPTDAPTLTIVSMTMLVIALVACLIPAWRATRVDPLVVIRES
jgi:putative ABC transport system permease protein